MDLRLSSSEQLAVILGQRVDDSRAEDRIAEDRIDRIVKRFLSKCWNQRSEVTDAVNEVLSTAYGIYSAPVA